MSSDCLCVCENMCSCPCHSVTCICCPCGKDRQDAQTSKINYYKNLYEQVKSELECEKRKNDKMMYDKQMQKNDLQSFENEQKNLLSENERLKQTSLTHGASPNFSLSHSLHISLSFDIVYNPLTNFFCSILLTTLDLNFRCTHIGI